MGVEILFYLLDFSEVNLIRDYNFSFDTLVDLVVIVLLSITLLVIIAAPVFMLCCWTIYSIDYVKNYRPKFSVQKWFTGKSDIKLSELSDLIWLQYRITYSRMVGFGFSIIGYGIACTYYLIQNFKRIEEGLTEYFSFPFTVVENLDEFKSLSSTESIDDILFPNEEVWVEMIYVVVVSAIFFLAGYLFASFLVDYRLKKMKKSLSRKIKKKGSKEEIFILK